MQKMALSFFCLILLISSSARSEQNPLDIDLPHFPDPPSNKSSIIEVGAGIEGALNRNGINVLLKVNYGFDFLENPENPRTIEGYEHMLIAHFSGDIAFTTSEKGETIPYFKVEFTPYQYDIAISGTPIFGNLIVLDSKVQREVTLNQDVSVLIEAIGVGIHGYKKYSDQFGVFVQIAADLLGYKYINYLSKDTRSFQGVHLGGVGFDVGTIFNPTDEFSVHVFLGGSAETNVAAFWIGDLENELEAHLNISADVTSFKDVFLRFFVDLRTVGAWDSLIGSFENSNQLMTGITLIF